MPNPAQLLLDQFREWSDDKTPPTAARGLNTQEADKSLRAHVKAMGYIQVLIEFVDDLERKGRTVDRYQRAIPMWIRAVLAHPTGWNEARTNQQIFTAHAPDVLEGLVDHIDRDLPELTVDQRDGAWRFLDEIAELLDSDGEMDERLRQYIHSLLQHIRDCLEDYGTHGAFDLRQALIKLWVAVQAAENESSGETKQRWATFREKIWPAAAGGFLGSLPQLSVAAAQLTQGGG